MNSGDGDLYQSAMCARRVSLPFRPGAHFVEMHVCSEIKKGSNKRAMNSKNRTVSYFQTDRVVRLCDGPFCSVVDSVAVSIGGTVVRGDDRHIRLWTVQQLSASYALSYVPGLCRRVSALITRDKLMILLKIASENREEIILTGSH